MDPKKMAAFANKNQAKPSIPASDHADADEEEHDDDELEAGDEHDTDETDEEVAARVGAEVQSGEEGKVDEDLVNDMLDFAPGDPRPDWATDEDIWDRAVKAVDPDADGDGKFDDPWLVVAHVYKALGGECDHEESEEPGGPGHKEPDGDEHEEREPAPND